MRVFANSLITSVVALGFMVVVSGCSTTHKCGVVRAENDTDKQYGLFVDHDSADGRGGVGNYVDRISWDDMPVAAAPKPVEVAPAKVETPAATTTTTPTTKKKTSAKKSKAPKAGKKSN